MPVLSPDLSAPDLSADERARPACYKRPMSREEIALVLERAASWPEEAQARLIRAALEIEREHAGIYRLSEAERADLRQAVAEFEHGDVASDADVKAAFEQLLEE